jgi:type II secretory pathway pseudopilin PulG
MKTNCTQWKHQKAPRGILVMDVVWGILLAMALLMAMTVAVVKQSRAERQLSATRAASRTAEEALLALETGQRVPPGTTVEKIAADAPRGRAWVRVKVSGHGAAGELVGLVKADAVEGVQ